MESFAPRRAEVDARLASRGTAPLGDAEFIAARLYTGPLYLKYNTTLRAAPGKSVSLTNIFEALCQGNKCAAASARMPGLHMGLPPPPHPSASTLCSV